MNGMTMRRATLVLGLAGGLVGMLLASIVIVENSVEVDAHQGTVIFGVSSLVAAAGGAVCAGLYTRGVRPVAMALGMMVAAAVHVVSSPIFGLPGGLLLLLGGLCGLLAIEEIMARGREAGRAIEPAPGENG